MQFDNRQRHVLIAPKKSLGQNFLTDANIARKIVDQFGPTHDDTVVEIGPGEGALTQLLAGRARRLVAIELDPRAADVIRGRHGEDVTVLEQDVLTCNLTALAASLGAGRLRVIGNIPYYITSPILFHLLDHRAAIADAMLMMQREVADRLVAAPRTKAYGILAVMAQTYTAPKRLFDVGPRCFRPAPKVTSAVVHFRFRDAEGIAGIEHEHRVIVRAAFNQRRKTLRNSLAQLLPTDDERGRVFSKAEIEGSARAEELSPADFIRLARVFADASARGPR